MKWPKLGSASPPWLNPAACGGLKCFSVSLHRLGHEILCRETLRAVAQGEGKPEDGEAHDGNYPLKHEGVGGGIERQKLLKEDRDAVEKSVEGYRQPEPGDILAA